VVRPEHHSANDRDFDELYRSILSNVYHAWKASTRELTADHQRRSAAQRYIPQTAYVARPRRRSGQRILRVDGRGELHLRSAHQAMHGKQLLLDAFTRDSTPILSLAVSTFITTFRKTRILLGR